MDKLMIKLENFSVGCITDNCTDLHTANVVIDIDKKTIDVTWLMACGFCSLTQKGEDLLADRLVEELHLTTQRDDLFTYEYIA